MTAPSLALADLREVGKLTTRAYRALRSEGVETLDQLATWRAIKLAHTPTSAPSPWRKFESS